MGKKKKVSNNKVKVIEIIYCYPDMRGIGRLYQNQLNFKTNATALSVIQSEIKRMSYLNYLLVEKILKEIPSDAFYKELENRILEQIHTEEEIKLLSEEEKRSSLVRLLVPKEQDIFKVYRND